MNIMLRLIIILFIISFLKGDKQSPLFNSIQSHLNKYRQEISSDDFSFQNEIIHLELEGRRTNIKSQFILGFYSVGVSLHRADIYCREIEILINYEQKTGSQISARAPVEKVIALSKGKLNSEQFFILIGY